MQTDMISPEHEDREQFILKSLFLLAEDRLSKDQKQQLHESDYAKVYQSLLDGQLKIGDIRLFSPAELFDLLIGQLRIF